MLTPPVASDIADTAPSYDKEHLATYLCLLDAHAEGAKSHEWCCVLIENMNVIETGRRSRHLSCARWMTEHGYRHLLRGGASA